MLNLLLILIVYSSKMIVNNINKIVFYEIKEDILTIQDDEYSLLNEVKEEIRLNKDVYEIFFKYKNGEIVSYNHIYTKDKKLIFKIDINNEKLLIEDRRESSISYLVREFDFQIIDNEERKVIFIPKLYKIYLS